LTKAASRFSAGGARLPVGNKEKMPERATKGTAYRRSNGMADLKVKEMAERPLDALQLRLPYKEARVDVSVWEGREKDGKAMPSNIALRLKEERVYLGAKDALALASVLQSYAFRVLELDSARRLEAWKNRQQSA